jgi:hypothetical protein
VRTLQDGGLCCDKITVLVKRITGNVDMLWVLFDDIISYYRELQSLLEAYGASKEFETKLYDYASRAWAIMRLWMGPREIAACPEDASGQLHLCALVCQILAISLISYSQAHTSDFHPHLPKEPLQNIKLEGYAGHAHPKITAEFSYQKLACMDGLIGGRVLVLSLSVESTSRGDTITAAEAGGDEDGNESQPSWFTGSIENIIDSWGPGVLISDANPDVPYGENVRSVMIAGSVIAPSSASDLPAIVYHWGRFDAPNNGDLMFNIRESLRIGAITVQCCWTLNSEKCRKVSEPYLDNLGTEADYWRLAERQMMLQSGQYVGLQVGSVYSKMKGRSLKTTLLDMWGVMPDLRLLLQPWGLQVSLCTGVARRVPLKALIGEPMFSYIDGISLQHWDDIKAGIQLAFDGTIDCISWTSGLQGPQRDCLIKVVTFFLAVLQDTGVDREGKLLRMLWPHEKSLSHAISLKCSKYNLWARVLKDSPSCATFAAVTSTCLEAPGHQCHRNAAPIWTGQGALLSTAVSRILFPGSLSTSEATHWELKNGQQCWIEKAGSDIWVYTTKEPNSDTQLRVKINRFPKGLSIFRDWQVLRERQDATFEAEEVVVFGTIA